MLTAGGIISFALGRPDAVQYGRARIQTFFGYIIPVTLITAAFFIFVVSRGVRAQFLPVRAGRETLIGKVVKAEDPINTEAGRVFVEGEYWNAVSDTPVAAGQPVEIVGVQRLMLKVKPKPKPRKLLWMPLPNSCRSVHGSFPFSFSAPLCCRR